MRRPKIPISQASYPRFPAFGDLRSGLTLAALAPSLYPLGARATSVRPPKLGGPSRIFCHPYLIRNKNFCQHLFPIVF
jgi:hypothetical protein